MIFIVISFRTYVQYVWYLSLPYGSEFILSLPLSKTNPQSMLMRDVFENKKKYINVLAFESPQMYFYHKILCAYQKRVENPFK